MKLSSRKRRLQKTLKEGCLQGVGLETRGVAKAHSFSVATSYEKTRPDNQTIVLLERIVNKDNMNKAVKRVISNKGSHGIDGMRVEKLRSYLMEHGKSLVAKMLAGSYIPKPVRKVDIPKPDGGTRGLGIPTVVDRVVQQAIAQVLTEVFEPGFSESSYGFRPNRSAQMAISQARKFMNDGYKYVVDLDIEKFFDKVNHDILMGLLAKTVQDRRILRLVRKYLTAGIMEDGIKVRNEEGTPQGGPLSPLLSNIMLNEFDKELEKRGHKFCRYADDCNIYVKSKRAGNRIMESMTKFLQEKLKLKVNAAKSAVASPTRRKFLGYSFYPVKNGYKQRVHPKSVNRLKDKIREVTNRNVSMNFEARLKRLIEVTRGWVNYFKLAEMKKLLKDLDEWVRRRLRACIWKTWKKPRTKFANLKKLGIPPGKAWEYANTRKGYWRISNSPVVTRAITNERLIKRGYIGMATMYEKIRLV